MNVLVIVELSQWIYSVYAILDNVILISLFIEIMLWKSEFMFYISNPREFHEDF